MLRRRSPAAARRPRCVTDAREGGGERPGLLVGELGGEVLVDTAGVDRPGPPEGRPPCWCDDGERAPAIRGARLPPHVAGLLHPVDEPGEPAARDHDSVCQLAHPQPPASRLGQLREDVVEGERHPVLGFELPLEDAEDSGMGPDEGAPGGQLVLAQGAAHTCEGNGPE